MVLYALGVGAGFHELHFVYEDRLKVIPSFSIASIFEFLAETAVKANVDLSGILHGEQDIIFHNPIPTEGKLITEGRVTHIYDKGKEKGALVMSEAVTRHSGGQKLFTNYFTLFCRKDGGFGGEPGPSSSMEMPEREPDFVHQDLPIPSSPWSTACPAISSPCTWTRTTPSAAGSRSRSCTGCAPTASPAAR